MGTYFGNEEMAIESLLRYPGGKSRLYNKIKDVIPPHRIWVDATWGAGSISVKKPASEWEIACDINPRIINFYKCVQRDYLQIAYEVARHDYSEKSFDWASDWEFHTGIIGATKWIIRNRQSFDGNCKQWTWSDRKRRGMPEFLSVWQRMPERIIAFGRRIKDMRFYVADIERSIRLVKDIPDACIYIDLPYKTDGPRTTKKLYEMDTFPLTHTRMLDAIQHAKCHSVIMHYEDDEYYQKLSSWSIKEINVKLNMGNRAIKNSRKELVFYK